MTPPLRVWAPEAQEVHAVLGEERVPMRSAAGGWWELFDDALVDGADYAISLDGSEPLPDPRAPSLPHGVDGPARWVDHSLHRWQDVGWQGIDLATAVIYELHVGTFSAAGTFDGVAEHLDHLVDLGVTLVELLPLNSFPGRWGWGYDGVGLYAPHHAYGGPDGLKRLVEACHARGLGVCVDVVYNHLGPQGNHLPRFGPYFTEAHHTPWGPAVNLDQAGSDEVRRFFVDNALMWLRDYHVDALRLDAVHAYVDESAVHLLEELATDVARLESAEHAFPRWLIAESDLNDPRIVTPQEQGGYGIDAAWTDDFHHALRVTLTGERPGYYADYDGLEDLATTLRHVYKFAQTYSANRGRKHGRSADGLPSWRFLGYDQNHDQVGNRPQGDRLAATLGPGRLRIASALALLAPTTPMLFQGEEWAASSPFAYFTDHQDPALAQAVSEGRKSEFPHFQGQEVADPQDPATFERSKLDWSELGEGRHAELLDWYRRVVALRRERPELGRTPVGSLPVAWDERASWLVMAPADLVVAVNLGAAQPVPLDVVGAGAGALEVVLASDPDVAVEGPSVRLPADAVAVLRRL